MSKKKFIGIIAAALCVVAILAVALVVLLRDTGPDSPSDQLFLSGTTINGQDVSGLSAEDAASALAERTQGYSFTLHMGEKAYTLTGEELALAYNQDADLLPLLERQKEDASQLSFTVDGLYTADVSALRSQLELDYAPLSVGDPADPAEGEEAAPAGGETENEAGETVPTQMVDPNAPKNAYLKYDETAASFVIVPDEPGTNVDCGSVSEQALEAILKLESELTLDMEQFVQQAEVTADSEEMQNALAEANSYLDLELTYTFTPEGGSTSSETISREILGSIFYLDGEDMVVRVDEEILGNYVNTLVEKYSVSGKTSQFKTTGGSYININVAQAGQSVDPTELYNDLLDCLSNKVSGTRTAPYLKSSDNANGFWGGNYVEIDLTSQHLWCYKNGKCVVSCDVVSGCVADNTRTPTGCFTIFAKNTDRYLQGNNTDGTRYKTWVSYFMPFSGGCGIHDATWRSRFGGNIYLYEGSHGCVGTTLSNAKTIFNNVSVGTHVVVYGGMSASSLPSKTPTITFPQSEYYVEVGQTLDLGNTTDSDGNMWLSNSNGNISILDNHTIRGESVGDALVGCYVDASSSYRTGSKNVMIHVVPAGSLAKDQNISASVGATNLTVGGTTAISVSGNATAPTFSSSNTGVITVDANGNVKAVGAGSAVVTVTCPETTGYRAASTTVSFTVTNPAPIEQHITASAGASALEVGGATTISVSGCQTRLVFTSDNPAVATVDDSGNVHAVGAGTVTITVIAVGENGYAEATASVVITVSQPTPVVPPEGPGSGSSGN